MRSIVDRGINVASVLLRPHVARHIAPRTTLRFCVQYVFGVDAGSGECLAGPGSVLEGVREVESQVTNRPLT